MVQTAFQFQETDTAMQHRTMTSEATPGGACRTSDAKKHYLPYGRSLCLRSHISTAICVDLDLRNRELTSRLISGREELHTGKLQLHGHILKPLVGLCWPSNESLARESVDLVNAADLGIPKNYCTRLGLRQAPSDLRTL